MHEASAGNRKYYLQLFRKEFCKVVAKANVKKLLYYLLVLSFSQRQIQWVENEIKISPGAGKTW